MQKITMSDVPEASPRLLLPNLQLVLGTWMDRHNEASFPWEPPTKDEVEIGFSYPLDKDRCVCGCMRAQHAKGQTRSGKTIRKECNGCGSCPKYQELQFCGKMDLLPKSRTDKRVHVPVDHKTTYRIDGTWVRSWLTDSQMSGYVWAARNHCGEHVNTCFINAIQLTEVPTSNRRCATHDLPYEECGPEHLKFEIVGPINRSDAQVKKWVADTQRNAKKHRENLLRFTLGKHRDLPMEGTFHGACGRCEFQDWCEEERRNDIDALQYIQRSWSPIAHALPGTKPKGSVFYIDNSTMRAITTCSTQAVARYGWDYTRSEQAAPLRAGIALHRGLEVWFKGGTARKALAAMEEAYNAGDEGEDE